MIVRIGAGCGRTLTLPAMSRVRRYVDIASDCPLLDRSVLGQRCRGRLCGNTKIESGSARHELKATDRYTLQVYLLRGEADRKVPFSAVGVGPPS